MKKILMIVTLLGLLVCQPCLLAQAPDPSLLTVERIFGEPEGEQEFAPALFGSVHWLATGEGFTRMTPSNKILQ